jgi:hypothetical protein
MKCSLRSLWFFWSEPNPNYSERMRYSLSGDHEGNTEEETNGYVVF